MSKLKVSITDLGQGQKLEISVEEHCVALRHSQEDQQFREVKVYSIRLSSPSGCCEESVRTEDELSAFLRGVQAGAAMLGMYVSMPKEPFGDI